MRYIRIFGAYLNVFYNPYEQRAVETDREMEEADTNSADLERNVVAAESRDETAGKICFLQIFFSRHIDSCVFL